MKTPIFYGFLFHLCVFGGTIVSAQEIPNDANHLPQMIGGRNTVNQRVDAVTVSGKITVEGIPASQPKPVVYVLAYSFGRFVDKKQVSENGSYSLNSVPREGSTLSVEIENTEVATRQIMPTPSSVIYQDITVNWLQVQNFKSKASVLSVKNSYERTGESQKLFEKAVSALNEKKNENAASLFRQIIKADPKDFVSLFQLGNILFLSEKYSEAEDLYLQSIEQNPQFLPASINLGKLYITQKDADKSIAVLTKAVEIAADSADAQHYLGEAHLQAKKGSKAVVYLNEAIRLAPVEKAEVHLRLAALYNAAGLKDRAASEYKMFLEKVPAYPEKEKLQRYIRENAAQ